MRTTTVLVSLCFAVLSPAAAAADLAVELDDVRVATGQLMVSVVDSADAWNGKARPVRGQSAAPTGTRARFEFKDLPPGDYAVMVMHDENGNGKLDSNMIGMPVEGYGFSNNPNVMRKPTFEEARFTLPQAGATIGISLR